MQLVLTYLMSMGLLLSATGCASAPAAVESDRLLNMSSPEASKTTPSSSVQPLWSEEVSPWAIALIDQTVPKTIPVTLYTADSFCSTFEAKTVTLPKEGAIAQAVGAVLADESVDSVPIMGYRVEQRLSGTVRVDLRFMPTMSRSVYALSSCEQFALFGSVRTTLLQNPDWQITQVIFTERGKELAL